MKKKINTLYQKIPHWLKNKYLISGLLFFIWILFFDANSILTQTEKQKKIEKLTQDIEYYTKEIKTDGEIIKTLSQDSLNSKIEKYFRENLFFSKKNEEVFIIE